jgi:hypothetical protein
MILKGQAKEDYLKWYDLNYSHISVESFNSDEDFQLNLKKLKILENSLITQWFDSMGITVDVMPRMNENKVVFEPNTFCLKHEISTENFIQCDNRFDANIIAIEKANEIYNTYFNTSN